MEDRAIVADPGSDVAVTAVSREDPMRHRMIIAAIGLAALIVPVAAATAQIQTPRRERVTLAAGSTSTTIKGAIRSHESID